MKKPAFLTLFLFLVLWSSAQTDSLLLLADQACSARDFVKARSLYNQILEQVPTNAKALVGLGNCQLYINDTASAVEYYKRAIIADPYEFEAYKALGSFYLHNNYLDKAKELFYGYLGLKPGSAEANMWLGTVYLYMHKPDSASMFFEKALYNSQDPKQVYMHIAQTFATIENYDSALAYVNKALTDFGEDDWLYYEKAKIETDAGRWDDALADIDKAISLNNGKTDYFLEKLSILLYANRVDEAIRLGWQYSKFMTDSNFYYLVGSAMFQSNSSLDSIKAFLLRGLRFSGAATLNYLLGLAYQFEGKYDSAYHYFSVASEKMPWDIEFYKEMVLSKLIMNSTGLDQNLYFKNFRPSNLKELKKLARSKKSKYYYDKLLRKFKNNPLKLGLDEFLMLYVGETLKKDYSPDFREKAYLDVKKSLDSQDVNMALDLAQSYLAVDPVNPGLYSLLFFIHYSNNDLKAFHKTYAAYLGLVFAITATGDGHNKRNAMISAAHIDEYIVLNFLGYDQLIRQTLIYDKDNVYRLYETALNGQINEYYFNLDLYKKFLKHRD